uniref:Uncharacterized protein n=1 Tax=Rhizophora mucronata TaxID=61149 RepID=A0A2P2Q714_RHIMU
MLVGFMIARSETDLRDSIRFSNLSLALMLIPD